MHQGFSELTPAHINGYFGFFGLLSLMLPERALISSVGEYSEDSTAFKQHLKMYILRANLARKRPGKKKVKDTLTAAKHTFLVLPDGSKKICLKSQISDYMIHNL